MERLNLPPAPGSRPRSVTHFLPCCAAYGLLAAIIFGGALAGLHAIFLSIAVIVTGVASLLYIEHRWPSADRSGARVLRPLPPRNWPRVAVKLVGLGLTLFVLTSLYAVLTPAIEKNARTFLTLWPMGLIGIVALSPIVFAETDRRMAKPQDAYFEIGRALLFKPNALTWDMLRTHILSWVVKGFFLPLMLSWFIKLVVILSATLADPSLPRLEVFLMVTMLMLFMVDLLGDVIGYAMTFKALGSHIRSVNPSLTGWVAVLLCYPPFYYLITTLLEHVEDLAWIDHLVANPAFVPLAVPIIALQMIYTLGTVNFGLRCSNLTHRGIVTGGVYRWAKHPAYLAKNCFWWLMSIPFIGHGPEAQWAIICIVSVNIIYFVRAKTEEIHLMSDPTYRAYARWIDDHGLFAPFTKARKWAVGVFQPASQSRPGWQPAFR